MVTIIRREAEEKARRRAVDAAEAQRQAQRQAEEVQWKRRSWRIELLMAIIGFALGLVFSFASLALERLAGIVPAIAAFFFLSSAIVSGVQLFLTGDSLGKRARWWHYAIAAAILVMSLAGFALWVVIIKSGE